MSTRLIVRNTGAIIELNHCKEPISFTQGSFSPLCLSVGAIQSLEPYSPSKYYSGVRTSLFLRKNGRNADTLKVRESYDEVKALIQRAQSEGFATLTELESSNH